MRVFRFYILKSGDEIPGTPFIVDCKGDQEAIDLARKMVDKYDIEIWEGFRRVTRIKGRNVA